MSNDELLPPNEAYEAIRDSGKGSRQAYDDIHNRLMEAVTATHAYEDFELSETDASRVADALFDYQLELYFVEQNKKRYRIKAQERELKAAHNSIKDTVERIGSILDNPAVCGAVSNAVLREFGWPDSEINPYKILFETGQRLESLSAALEMLEVDDLPALTFGLKKDDLVCRIHNVVTPYTDAKKTLSADCIGDFLKLIDIKLERKTILNILS